MNKPNIGLDPPFLDEEERELIQAFERGEYNDDKLLSQEAREEIEEAARNALKKTPINIRIQDYDLRMIKLKAQQDGVPYQTLIQSVLHRYAEEPLDAPIE